jgi:hypothetical protein
MTAGRIVREHWCTNQKFTLSISFHHGSVCSYATWPVIIVFTIDTLKRVKFRDNYPDVHAYPYQGTHGEMTLWPPALTRYHSSTSLVEIFEEYSHSWNRLYVSGFIFLVLKFTLLGQRVFSPLFSLLVAPKQYDRSEGTIILV